MMMPMTNEIINAVMNNIAISRGIIKALANKDYDETEYHQAFVVNANAKGYTFTDDDRPKLILQSFFSATSQFLSKVKTMKEDEATALVLTSISGDFEFAAIVEYHPNEENPDEPGNWSYTMTFYEDDIKALEREKTVKKHLYNSDAFRTVFNNTCNDIACINFNHDSYIYDALLLCVLTIKQILDREALIGETVEFVMPGFFIASVAVENGEKVFSIVPDGVLKSIIKDDLAIEK